MSQSIHEIEAELGVILFDRIGKRLHLIEEGKVFLNYVRRILNLYEEGTETLKAMTSMEKGKIDSHEISIKKIWDDELVFICSNSHKWNRRKYIQRDELKNEKFIMRERGSGTREIIENYLRDKNNIDFKVFMKLGNTEAIKKSVEANLGIGCISLKCVDNKLHIVRLKEDRIFRELYLIMHKDKFINNNMKEFINSAYK